MSALASHDSATAHHTSAQARRSPTVTLRLRHRPPGTTASTPDETASARFALVGQYNATHPDGGRWIPQVRVNTTDVTGTQAGLSAVARVRQVHEAGQDGQSMPALRISLQIKLDDVLHSSIRFADFAARGDRGFGLLNYGAQQD